MQNLLTGLLELSRIGRVINPNETIDVNKLIRSVLELLSGIIQSKNVNIEVMKDMPPVYGDRQRLMEVFQNLIENAVKYFGEQRKPKITIGFEKIENTTYYFVQDNGIGLDMKYKDKIFNLFDQLNHTSEGTGVGLALVKRIIEFHGGEIKVYSEGINKGAKFYFSLPSKNTAL
jgi:signal transduction histidine kinase